MNTLKLSNIHAERVGWNLTAAGRSWRITHQDEDQFGIATVETDASRAEVETAMTASVDAVGDQCSAIDWRGEVMP